MLVQLLLLHPDATASATVRREPLPVKEEAVLPAMKTTELHPLNTHHVQGRGGGGGGEGLRRRGSVKIEIAWHLALLAFTCVKIEIA